MKVLVTGGGGFLGRSVIHALMKNNIHARAFDLSGQIEREPMPEGVEVYKGSILDINALSNAMNGCDCVIHLAAMLGVGRTEKMRLGCLSINISGTFNILEACVKDNIKKIIFASSSEIYGEPVKMPIKETYPLNPMSTYAITKLAGEEYVKAYGERYGLSYKILRFFNIYGPGQVAEFVIPRFVKAVALGQRPLIYGDGMQTRSFCHVNDTALGVCMALVHDHSDGDTFNIGNSEEPISMLDLAKKVIKISGKKLEPKFVDWKESDRKQSRDIIRRVPDVTKAKEVLGFKPSISLDAGLKELFNSPIEDTWAKIANYKI